MDNIFSNRPDIDAEKETSRIYKNWRENFALPLLVGVLIFGAFVLFPAILASDSLVQKTFFISTYLLTIVVTVVRFSYPVRMIIFLLNIYILGIGELLTYGTNGDSLFFFLSLTTFATMMFSVQAGIASIIINLITYAIFGTLYVNGLLVPSSPQGSPATVAGWISEALAMLMFTMIIILGFRSLEREFFEARKQIDTTLNTLKNERSNLENKVQERTKQFKKINQLGHDVIEVLNVNELFARASKFIEVEFGFYHTAFYLLDASQKWADLSYASGEAGKVLKENKHRLNLSGKSNVAKSIREKTTQLIVDISQIRSENPLLPYTKSQLTLPLLSGETVLGALDVHSTKEDAFTAQDIDAYQNMANSIAIAIENSRLFEEAQQNLAEMRATQRQYLQNAWDTLSTETPLQYELGERSISKNNELELSLTLRDQVIGKIQMGNSAEWTSEQKNLVESIIAQTSLALENARLVEESQSTAIQERLTNEIIAKIWASTSMDSILQTAVRELGRGLEVNEVEIEVSMDKYQDDK